MQVLQAHQNLLGNYFDFVLLIQLKQTFAAPFSDELGQAHIHELEDQIESSVLKLNSFGLHDIRTVGVFFPSLDLVKPL